MNTGANALCLLVLQWAGHHDPAQGNHLHPHRNGCVLGPAILYKPEVLVSNLQWFGYCYLYMSFELWKKKKRLPHETDVSWDGTPVAEPVGELLGKAQLPQRFRSYE